MKKKQKQKKHILRRLLMVIIILAISLGVVMAVYLGNYYHADETAEADLATEKVEITTEEDSKGNLLFVPTDSDNIDAGFIFYPGGKVEYTSYTPLMTKLAEEGIACILVKMPGNLAIFDIDAAKGLQEEIPEVEDWYIGGHSLGGASACLYLEKAASEYKGLVLMGAYSSKDLSNTDLSVLSMYGENDGVMNRENYEKYKSNLPEDFTEYVIPGGCHSYFGSYGMQDGDGTPTITEEEQQTLVAQKMLEWIEER